MPVVGQVVVGENAATVGAGRFLKGSGIGAAGETHLPVVPELNTAGIAGAFAEPAAGPPKTPKSDPLKLGPPWLKSIARLPLLVQLPELFVVAAAHVWLLEFT